MDINKIDLLLADDDQDDCLFFQEALEDLGISANLVTVHDGVELMELIRKSSESLPDLLFLDLNMPRKSGYDCLSEIKLIDKLNKLPIIIFSTSLELGVVEALYDMGASLYIRKPGEFTALKRVISEAFFRTMEDNFKRPTREEFILES